MALITKQRQNYIDQRINKILVQTNRSYPEDSLLDIVKGLDIEVKVADFEKYAEVVSGMILHDKESKKPTIYLNERNSRERQTFTLAHELGHYLLHDGAKLRIDKYNYSTNSKEALEEIEANYFAASLLMPQERFEQTLKLATTLKQIARYFGVSESAVRNRIRWLKMN